MLVKIYGSSLDSAKGRYSPAECTGAKKVKIEGNPDKKRVICRAPEPDYADAHAPLTRLTTAFPRKSRLTLTSSRFTSCYNFVRIHATPRFAWHRLWPVALLASFGIADIVALIEAKEAEKPMVHGTYKKQSQISN